MTSEGENIIIQPDCAGECLFRLSDTNTLSRLLAVAETGYFLWKKTSKLTRHCSHYPAVVEANKLASETGNFAAEQRDVKKAE